MMPSNFPVPASVCLLRLSALGDVCHCIALVRALQRAWPETRISWIIGPLEHQLVADLPDVEFIVHNKRDGLSGLWALRRRLKRRRFDWLLHAQVSLRANLIASQVRYRYRLGFDRRRAREGHQWLRGFRIASVHQQHQADAMLEFARFFSIDTEQIDPAPPIPEGARAFARLHQPTPRRAVLISPASSHSGRNWSATAYAELNDWIQDTLERPVILIGGPSASEKSLADSICRQAHKPPLNLVGQDTLKQALAMLDRAACLVTPDSGPAHFASALGTPVVGLYAATWSQRSGPRSSLDLCVDRYPEAARQFMGKAPDALRWGQRIEKPGVMGLIDVDSVKHKLELALSRQQQRRS